MDEMINGKNKSNGYSLCCKVNKLTDLAYNI